VPAAIVCLWALSSVAGSALSQNVDGQEYIDDRSSGTQLIRSYFNAVDRREYARAYSYWEPGAAASQLPPFEEFAAGYADTAHADIVLGDVQTDVGAGQLYYLVPVGITAVATDGTVSSYVGCYQAHLARPQLQAVPPFHPMGIQRATVRALGADEDMTAALDDACVR
jgi:hypothetical protein